MDNLALDYEKKERLESVRIQQSNLNRFTHADNYDKGGIRTAHADNYPSSNVPGKADDQTRRRNLQLVKKPDRPSDFHLKDYSQEDQAETQDDEQERANRLAEARNAASKPMGDAKNEAGQLMELATPGGMFSLAKQISVFSDMPFVAALGAAIFKDLLDGLFNVMLIGAFFSVLYTIFSFLMLLLAGANGKKGAAGGMIKKGLILLGGGLIDAIPGIGFLPIETLTIGVIYLMTLAERKNSK